MRRKKRMNSGIATTTTHAPLVNLASRKMSVETPVAVAPRALSAARERQRAGASPPPVHDQAGLRKREADEHADGEERDQGVGVAADGDEQSSGHDGQSPDAVAEHEAVSAQREQVRQWSSRARRPANTGRPPNEVFAASASTTVMVSDSR
jgi:hypothetical protein